MSKMSKMSKYENGYMGKIQYWTGKLNDEVMNTKEPDLREIDRIHQKLDYFIQRQFDSKVVMAVKDSVEPLVGDAFLRSVGIIK